MSQQLSHNDAHKWAKICFDILQWMDAQQFISEEYKHPIRREIAEYKQDKQNFQRGIVESFDPYSDNNRESPRSPSGEGVPPRNSSFYYKEHQQSKDIRVKGEVKLSDL